MKTGLDRFTVKGREASIQMRQERAKRRAAELAPVIAELQAGGATTLQAIAAALNERGILTARGGIWSAVQVRRVIARTVQSGGPGHSIGADAPPAGLADDGVLSETRVLYVTRADAQPSKLA